MIGSRVNNILSIFNQSLDSIYRKQIESFIVQYYARLPFALSLAWRTIKNKPNSTAGTAIKPSGGATADRDPATTAVPKSISAFFKYVIFLHPDITTKFATITSHMSSIRCCKGQLYRTKLLVFVHYIYVACNQSLLIVMNQGNISDFLQFQVCSA